MNTIKSRRHEDRSNSQKRKRAEEGADLDICSFFANAVKFISSRQQQRRDLLGGRQHKTQHKHMPNTSRLVCVCSSQPQKCGGESPENENTSFSGRTAGIDLGFDCFNWNVLLLLLQLQQLLLLLPLYVAQTVPRRCGFEADLAQTVPRLVGWR